MRQRSGQDNHRLDDAIYSAGKEKDREKVNAVNPLVENGGKLIPSVTRVFSKARDMYVYLQDFDRSEAGIGPLVAYVTFYRGEAKAFETAPLQIVDAPAPSSKAIDLRFSLSLDDLPTGEYNCQVSVISPSGRKVAFWQAPIMLIQ